MVQSAAGAQVQQERGQDSLFGGDSRSTVKINLEPQLPNIPMWKDQEKLAKEKEVLGFYVFRPSIAEIRKRDQCFC